MNTLDLRGIVHIHLSTYLYLVEQLLPSVSLSQLALPALPSVSRPLLRFSCDPHDH